ncbi:MAG: hypothetical protein ACFFBC_13660 [Promethearchaeota archaeon]
MVDMRKDYTFLVRLYLIRRVCAICGKKVKKKEDSEISKLKYRKKEGI